jgi:hypothetical protein
MWKNAKLSWVIFLALGAAMWALRYGHYVPQNYTEMLIKAGPFIVAGIHVILLLMAFQDSVYQGILSLLIPLYTFYWLFVISDSFFFRAIVAGLLVGIGQDSAAFYNTLVIEYSATVRTWIESGG